MTRQLSTIRPQARVTSGLFGMPENWAPQLAPPTSTEWCGVWTGPDRDKRTGHRQ